MGTGHSHDYAELIVRTVSRGRSVKVLGVVGAVVFLGPGPNINTAHTECVARTDRGARSERSIAASCVPIDRSTPALLISVRSC
jgi:hypothetical protein